MREREREREREKERRRENIRLQELLGKVISTFIFSFS